jgi:DNA-binding SARP family transcriptional activator
MQGEVRFAVLGPVCAWRGEAVLDLGEPKQRAVLAALLLREGAQATLEGLIDDVWGDESPATSPRAIRSYIYRLRLVLGRAGTGHIRSVGGGYILDTDPQLCDMTRFTHLVAQAGQAWAGGDPATAAAHYTEGLALWTGTALAGIPGPYAAAQRTRLNELRLNAQEERLACAVDLGLYDHAAAELSALVADHPLRERLRELQMLALYGAGRQAEALDAFRVTGLLLREELGVDPGPRLRAVHQRILNVDPALLHHTPAPPPRTTPSPPALTPVPVPAQLPADVAHFTGRTDQLDALTTLAGKAGSAVVISAIGGTAGIGKTALAVHWGHQAAAAFPDGQLYVNLRGFDPTDAPVPAETAIRGFLDALEVPSARIPADLDARVGLYRSLLGGKRMLVVLDNARDAHQVRPLLPGSAGCMVLVTSRNQLPGLVAVDGAHSLALDLLTPQEARDLLAHRLGAERVAAEPETVEELIELCARLPLALNITAARATAVQPAFPLAVFAAQLREARGRLSALDTGDVLANVRAVFSWSYNTLGGPAARMFRLLGLHPGPDITVPAAASLAATRHEQAHAALDELTRIHLLAEHTPGRYTFHDLLRAYAAEQARTHDADEEQHQALHRALDHYLHTADTANRFLNPTHAPIALPQPEPGVTPEALADDQQAWNWFTAEHQVLLAAIAQAAAHGLETRVCQLSWTLADFLERLGHWHDYRAAQTSALAAAQGLGDLAEQARAHRGLARAHTLFEAYPDTHAHLDLAIELYRRLGDPLGQARSRDHLALVLDRQGRYRDALEQAHQALPLYRTAGDHPGQANALNTIGWLHARTGEHQQALTYCEKALELCRGLGNRTVESALWDTLGYAHHNLGHHRRAIECYRHALDLFRKTRHRRDQAATLTRLGDTHHAAGDFDTARDAWEQAQTLFEDLQHPDAEQVRRKLKALT